MGPAYSEEARRERFAGAATRGITGWDSLASSARIRARHVGQGGFYGAIFDTSQVISRKQVHVFARLGSPAIEQKYAGASVNSLISIFNCLSVSPPFFYGVQNNYYFFLEFIFVY